MTLSVRTILYRTGDQAKYINEIQKSLNAPQRSLNVLYLVYRDPVKQDDDAVVDTALKAMPKAEKGRKRTHEDFVQFGAINHATISYDPVKYGIVKNAFIKRYLNDDPMTHELSQTNSVVLNLETLSVCLSVRPSVRRRSGPGLNAVA